MENNIINVEIWGKFNELFEALDFAAHRHRYQKRKGIRAVPYINHPIWVTKHILGHIVAPGMEMLQASLLHDTIEDTETTFEELQQKFGQRVADIVSELTDDMSLPYAVRKKLQVEHAKNLSFEARCIKIADKHCNVYDVLHTRLGWVRLRKIQYVKWAVSVVDQIRGTDPELEKAFDDLIEYAGKILKTEVR